MGNLKIWSRKCNVRSCMHCNEDFVKIPKIELERMKAEREMKGIIDIRKRKFCKLNCDHCYQTIKRIEEEDSWKSGMKKESESLNNVKFSIREENPVETKNKIMQSNTSDFVKMEMAKDGNCFFNSIIKSQNKKGSINRSELRFICSHLISTDTTITEEFYHSNGFRDKYDYASKIECDKTYGSDIEATLIAKEFDIWIAILQKSDINLNGSWIIYGNENIKPKSIIFLEFYRKVSDVNDIESHYNLLIRNDIPRAILSKENNPQIINENSQVQIMNDVKVLVWNIRSLKEYAKKLILIDVLRQNDIDIAMIQETFLKKEDKVYIQDYKIYRSNSEYRKGVMILVKKSFNVSIAKVEEDLQGRYLKIRITDRITNKITNISSLYLEPTFVVPEDFLSSNILKSDIIAEDMNNHGLNLTRKGVYHFKNLIYVKEVKVPNKVSDHEYLIFNAKANMSKFNSIQRIVTLQKSKVSLNEQKISNIVLNSNNNENLVLENPRIFKEIERQTKTEFNIEYWNSCDDYEQFKTSLRREMELKNESNKSSIEAIIHEGLCTKEAWNKMNSFLLQSGKVKIFDNPSLNNSVVEGFKMLYNSSNERSENYLEILRSSVYNILSINETQENFLVNTKSLEIPYSNACDYNGIRQKVLIKSIKSNNRLQEVKKLTKLFLDLRVITDMDSILLHNKTRIILFNKVEEVDNWKQLRPISIIPAWLICLEKCIKPLIDAIVNPVISNFQFGFKPKSNINIAKMAVIFNMRNNENKYAILVDIEKAYDSVNRDLLCEILDRKFGNNSPLIKEFLKIYSVLELELLDCTIFQKRGLPQGSALSPILFNVYLDDILIKINQETTSKLIAFADDQILQNKDKIKLQEDFTTLTTYLDRVGLKVNINKTEFLSSEENDSITDNNNNVIISKNCVKYLGQYIDADGNNITTINNSFFGKIIEILANHKTLTRRSRIKIFNVYMKSKFSHLIPIIAASDGIRDTWKKIRKIIFDYILNKATLPLESATLMKVGYYNIIIRPLLTLYNSMKFNEREEQVLQHETIKKCISLWHTIETNLPEEVISLISQITLQNFIPKTEDFDELVNKSAVKRLLKYREDNHLIEKLHGISLPNTILFCSNANFHEFESRIINYHSSLDETSKNAERERMESIIRSYKVVLYYLNNYNEIENILPDETKNSLEDKIQLFYQKEIEISLRVKKAIEETNNEVVELTTKIIRKNLNLKIERDFKIEELAILCDVFRKNIASSIKREKEIELVMEITKDVQRKECIKEQKKGPGRPPIIISTNSNQMKLDGFVVPIT